MLCVVAFWKLEENKQGIKLMHFCEGDQGIYVAVNHDGLTLRRLRRSLTYQSTKMI